MIGRRTFLDTLLGFSADGATGFKGTKQIADKLAYLATPINAEAVEAKQTATVNPPPDLEKKLSDPEAVIAGKIAEGLKKTKSGTNTQGYHDAYELFRSAYIGVNP